MNRRREELRRNRDARRAMVKKQKRRKRRTALACAVLLAVTAFCTVCFARFPKWYQERELKKTLEQSDATVAVVSKQEKAAVASDKKVTEQSPSPEQTKEDAGKAESQDEAAEQKAESSDFSQYSGYVSENETRYRDYQNRTGAAGDDVVWQVNARLDLQLFTDAVTVGSGRLEQDLLVIVNKYHRVPDGYQPSDLTYNSDGCQLRSETADAFDRMKQAAAASGLTLRAVSGYRSVDYQRNLYNSYLQGDSRENVDTYSARAGFSEHHTGMAVDAFGSVDGLNEFVTTPEYQWVKQHGHEYGFIIRYTAPEESVTGYMDEPWHLRYIGTEHATAMKTLGISTLEEYVGQNGAF